MRSLPRAHFPFTRGLAGGPRPGSTRRWRAAAPRPPHLFFVQRAADGGFAEVQVAAGATVAALVRAAVSELRLDVAPDLATLAPSEGGAALDATLTLDAALAMGALLPHAKLLVTLRAPPPSRPPLLDLAAFDNVLVGRPDSSLDAHLLAVLTSPSTAAHVRIAALGALVADVLARDASALGGTAALPVFNTVSHASLLESLVSHACVLAAGGFEGSNGTACRTLVGPRGIGKTVMLRAFAAVAASAFPSLVVIYITGENIKQRSTSCFRAADIAAVIEAASRTRGADASQHRGPFALPAALRSNGARVLLLLDEVDELYRVTDADGDARGHVLSSLGALQAIGGGTTGLFGVLACGSSASTHALVCANVCHLAAKFPLVAWGVPDLNDTKFRRLTIETAPCSRSDEVVAILAALAVHAGRLERPVEALKLARQLTFFAGVTPRAVLASLPVRGVVSVRAPNTSRLSETAHGLYWALLDALVIANASLRALTLKNGTLDVSALTDAACKWEEAVQPLPWPAVLAAWATCLAAHGVGARDDGLLVRLIDDLSDAHLIHIEDVQGNMRLWPITAAQVVAARAHPEAELTTDVFDVGAKVLREVLEAWSSPLLSSASPSP